jgi:outer membrane lipoprotein-sorting protein
MDYLGQEAVDGVSTHVIALEPLNPAGFQGARVWLDSRRWLLVQARIQMENGSVRTVTLSDIELDPPPEPARFVFVPPEGARVIRR